MNKKQSHHFLDSPDGKATLKFHNDELYLWPGSCVRQVDVVNGLVRGPQHRKTYFGRDADWMMNKLPEREARLIRQGFVVVVQAELLASKRLVDNYPNERGRS